MEKRGVETARKDGFAVEELVERTGGSAQGREEFHFVFMHKIINEAL